MSELQFRRMERADIGELSTLFCKVFSEPPWNEDVSPEEAQRYFERLCHNKWLIFDEK